VHQTNATAIVAFALAALFAVIAALFLASELRILRHRRRRALLLAERAGADATDTQLIPLDQVRAMAQENADTDDADAASSGTAAGDTSQGTTSEELTGDDTEAVPERGTEREATPTGTDQPDEDEPTPAQADVERKPLLGRHGDLDSPLDVVPPVRGPRDSGLIDVSAIRAGVAFPTRRVLREARDKGEHTVIIDGHEFDTGLIPQVGRRAAPGEGDQEGVDPAPGDTSPTHEGSWTSLVSGWIHSEKGHDDETHS
jgi:hypothetical protein